MHEFVHNKSLFKKIKVILEDIWIMGNSTDIGQTTCRSHCKLGVTLPKKNSHHPVVTETSSLFTNVLGRTSSITVTTGALYNHITTKESLPWCLFATISARVRKVRRQIRMSEIPFRPRTGYTVAAPNTVASGPQTIRQCCRALLLSKCSVALTTLKRRSVWHPPICPRIRPV